MLDRDIKPFDLATDAFLIPPGFPALAGITNNKAGDAGYGKFSSTEMGEEYRFSQLLAKKLCGVASYTKTTPGNVNCIDVAADFHGYVQANGLIVFARREKSEPGVLFVNSAGSPIVVFCSADQSLMAVIESGLTSWTEKMIGYAVSLIKGCSHLDASDLFAGIFPGICENYIGNKNTPEGIIKTNPQLIAAIRNQLLQDGVSSERIYLADYCEVCQQNSSAHQFFCTQSDFPAKVNTVFITRRT